MEDLAHYGKIPPQARDLEEVVLGACMLEKEVIGKVLSILEPDSFYFHSHGLIFKAISKLYNSGRPIDILTVTEELKRTGTLDEVGGAYYITELTNRVASGANAEEHAYIIAQKFIQREIIRVSGEIQKHAYEDITDVLDLLEHYTVQLLNITGKISKQTAKHISGVSKDNLLNIEKLSANPGKLLGYPTGLKDLDKMIFGMQSGVTVIAARPSMGKSSLMAQIITAIARTGVPCQIFTLEVSASKYELRMKSQLSGIHFERIQTGNIYRDEWEKLNNTTYEISELPIFIDDSAALSAIQLRSKCLQAYQEGVRCFAIDFIQLAEGGNDNEGLTLLSRSVKMISQELKVPFIQLSQLSREVEKRTDKKPMLSDLRNSGTLEENADVVIFLYRPEYYGLPAYDKDSNQVDNKGFAQIRVAKNKDGKVGTVDLKFIGENLTFKNYNDESPF